MPNIKTENNALGLSLDERALVLELITSIRRNVTRVADEIYNEEIGSYYYRDIINTRHGHVMFRAWCRELATTRVLDSMRRQATGEQKRPGKNYRFDRGFTEDDLKDVYAELGVAYPDPGIPRLKEAARA